MAKKKEEMGVPEETKSITGGLLKWRRKKKRWEYLQS